MRILIGYDGSECSQAAIDDLARAGLPNTAEALLVSVIERLSHAAPSDGNTVQSAVRCLGSMFPQWSIASEEHEGSAARVLIERSDAWKPDLMVVGSHGRSALGRLMLGSVAQKIVTEASCSVRVGRRSLQPKDAPVRILIGTDGSPGATAAVHAVAARHWPPHSQAHIVSAFWATPPQEEELELHEHVALQIAEWDARRQYRAQQIVRCGADILKNAGLEVSWEVRADSPKALLLSEARDWRADCVFVGATGSNRFDRFLLGSASTAAVMRVSCSVEVVRTDQEG